MGTYLISGLTLSADQTAVTVALNQTIPPDTSACVEILPGVTDVKGNSVSPNPVPVCVTLTFYSCFVQQEIWFNIGGISVSDLTGNARYPDSPDLIRYKPLVEANYPNDEFDNYGTRAVGMAESAHGRQLHVCHQRG